MNRLLGLLLYALATLSFGTASLSHGTEPQAGTVVAASQVALVAEAGHVQGDADEVPADGDRDYPHHHLGCPGDHVAMPSTCHASVTASILPAMVSDERGVPAPSHPADPALRPPRA